VGVLQHRDVEWKPELPDWKMEGIFGFHLTTYTKIFMNFDRQFWSDHEFTLYAHPTSRGLFSVWQNLNAPGYFPKGTKDNVFMVTVTQDYAHMVEAMTDEQVKGQLMATLRKMYPDETIPEPTDFKFPRWHSDPLFRGSYSNWPIGEVDQHHENMKAPLHNRVFFAGEAMSKDYYGYLQGGWVAGEEAAISVIQCIKKKKCPVATYYPEIVNAKMKGNTVLKKRAYIE
jgi:polyamine oxidase